MCLNDKIHKEDPSYYCEECYSNLHLEYLLIENIPDFYL